LIIFHAAPLSPLSFTPHDAFFSRHFRRHADAAAFDDAAAGRAPVGMMSDYMLRCSPRR